MASPVPEKSQPLHNFLLTHLKWKNHRSGRSRLAGESSTSSPPLRSHIHAPSSTYTSPPNASCRPLPPSKQSVIRDSSKRKISESSTKSVDYNNNGKRSDEISIRIRENSKQHDAADDGIRASTPTDDSVLPKAADDESSPKTWNLRPRRLPVNHKQSTGGFPMIGTSRLHENGDTRTTELRKFSIALSRGEIEEDVLFLTGSKPSRRPKKRPRAIQKQLDNLFPGLWLDSITADSYKVSETS